MKKLFVLVLALLFATCAYAESGASNDATITFRGFEWYAPFSEVHPLMERDSGSDFMPSFGYDETSIDSIYRVERAYMFSDHRVDEGGAEYYYYEIDVAGYVADVDIYYMYPIVDGAVLHDETKAEMYMAVYEFSELEDMPAVYEDLKTKLTALYGEGEERLDKYYDSVYWEDANGNAIWLVIDEDGEEIRLAYAAGGHIDRLAALEEQLSIDAAKAEDEARKENAGNTSGL